MITEGYLLIVDKEKFQRKLRFPITIMQMKCPARSCNYHFGIEAYKAAFSQEELLDEISIFAMNHHFIEMDPENSMQCPLCFSSVFKSEIIHVKECHHEFCLNCLRNFIDIYYIEKSKGVDQVHCIFIDKELKNCNCLIELNDIRKAIGNAMLNQLEDLKNKSEYHNIACCNIECQRSFSLLDTDNKEIVCPFCSFKICKQCKIPSHKGECDERKVQKFQEAMLKTSMQCPYCKNRNSNEKDHGETFNCLKCKKQICSNCWCKMERVKSHGKHYHRPNCIYYERIIETWESSKDNCIECNGKSEKCPKPCKPNQEGFYYNDSSEEIDLLEDN